MSVWELYTQLFARNWRYRRFARSLSQGCSEKIRKRDVVMTAGRWSSWSIQIPQFLMLWWPAMKAGSTAMTQRPRDRVPSGSMLALPDPRRPDRAIHPQNFDDPFFWQWDSLGRGQHSSNRVSGISTRTMHQSTTPSLSQTIWPRWAPRQFLSLPIVQTCDFRLIPKLRGCRYEKIEEMKEAATKAINTLTQEDFHGAFQKLLEQVLGTTSAL